MTEIKFERGTHPLERHEYFEKVIRENEDGNETLDDQLRSIAAAILVLAETVVTADARP